MSCNRFYSSNVQKPISSPRSQPEKVKTEDQEVKRSFALPVQADEEAGTWTKVFKGKQTTRRGLRDVAVLNSDEMKFSTPSPPSGRNGSVPPSIESTSSSTIKAKAKAKAKEKSRKDIDTLQAQVANLSTTLERLMAMLEGTKVNVPKGNQSPVRTPSPSVVGTPKASHHDALDRKSLSPSQAGSDPSSTSSSRSGSTASYPKFDDSLVVKFAIPVVCFSEAIPAVTAKKVMSRPSPPLTIDSSFSR